jgi:hypothetical protein
VDIKNSIAIFQFVEVAPAGIGFSWRSASQQVAQLLARFRAMIPDVLNIQLLIQPQKHPSSLSAFPICVNADLAKMFQKKHRAALPVAPPFPLKLA